jgi:G patch domain/KOW motif-containing protein
MAEAPRVTMKFGIVKRPVLNNIRSSAFQSESTTNNDQPELVTDIHNGEIKSTAPATIEKELVIPSQPNAHHKILKIPQTLRRLDAPNSALPDEAINQLNDDARRALILEAQQANEAWSERNENGTIRVATIEQDSTNTFMTDLEANDQTNGEQKDIENADYDKVSIEDFGMAVLRGMGYKEDAGLGISNKKQVNVFVPESRPRGLGLGADRKILEKINQLKRNLKQSGIDEKDDLCYEKGAFVRIEKGLHQDQYGTIESIEEDTARLTVSLAIGGTNRKKEIISISQYNVKLVTEKEYLKYSKYVNKSKAEQVEKETSDQLMKNYRQQNNHHEEKHSKRHRSSKKDDDDDDYERRHRHDESSRSRKH